MLLLFVLALLPGLADPQLDDHRPGPWPGFGRLQPQHAALPTRFSGDITFNGRGMQIALHQTVVGRHAHLHGAVRAGTAGHRARRHAVRCRRGHPRTRAVRRAHHPDPPAGAEPGFRRALHGVPARRIDRRRSGPGGPPVLGSRRGRPPHQGVPAGTARATASSRSPPRSIASWSSTSTASTTPGSPHSGPGRRSVLPEPIFELRLAGLGRHGVFAIGFGLRLLARLAWTWNAPLRGVQRR